MLQAACVSVGNASPVCSVCFADEDKVCVVYVLQDMSVVRTCVLYQRPECVPPICHCVVDKV